MKIGDQIGDYEVLGKLGSGGMGEVYKVRNRVSDRCEAMKVLLPDVSRDPDFVAARFEREIKVLAVFDHPHIARLYTAQVIDGQLVMLMEYLDGTSLEEILTGGAIPLQESIRYGSEVLDALAYAHSRQVIHRDIKPSNIMRSVSGCIKLMDFGIARRGAEDRLTQTGRAIGSPSYMAPEQINGSEPDARSDIYSFGVSLYEMLTGQRPFKGDGVVSVLTMHLRQAPRPPSEVDPRISDGLDNVVLKALAKDPAKRFQTAEEFRGALERVGGGGGCHVGLGASATLPPGAARSGVRGGRRGVYMALGSLATLLVLAAGVVEVPRLFRARANGSVPRTDAHASSPVSLGADRPGPPSVLGGPAAVPPGRGVASKSAGLLGDGRDAGRPLAQLGQVVPPAAGGAAPPGGVPGAKVPSVVVPKELRDRLTGLQGRAASFGNSLEEMGNQLKAQGLTLRPALSAALTTARGKLAQAESEMTSGAFSDAQGSLDAAEVALQKIEKIYGR